MVTYDYFYSTKQLPAQWNGSLPKEHHLCAEALALIENSGIEDFNYYYVIIKRANEVVGLAYFQLLTLKSKYLNLFEQRPLWNSMVQKITPNCVTILTCGNLFRIDQPCFYFLNKADESLIFYLFDDVVKDNKIRKIGAYLLKDCNHLIDIKNGFVSFGEDVTMELSRRNEWLNYHDYLNSLSKKYRKRLLKIEQHFEGCSARNLTLDEIKENAATIESLYWNVVNKQVVKLGAVNAEYFYQLKLYYGERFELHFIEKDNEVIGFFTYIFYDSHMETNYIGLDYRYNEEHQTYLNILRLSTAAMIDKKFSTLELGRTAKVAKTNMGAEPKPILNFIKIRNRFARICLNVVLKRFNKQDKADKTIRNPFK